MCAVPPKKDKMRWRVTVKLLPDSEVEMRLREQQGAPTKEKSHRSIQLSPLPSSKYEVSVIDKPAPKSL